MFFFERKGIDDPVGAISVHGVGGIFGVLCVGIFADGRYGAGWNLTESATNGKGVTGILYGSGKFRAAVPSVSSASGSWRRRRSVRS